MSAAPSVVAARFGAKLRAVRLKAGVSQERLADLAGLHRTYVSGVERGLRNISLENIDRLARALDVDMAALVPTRGELAGPTQAAGPSRRPTRS